MLVLTRRKRLKGNIMMLPKIAPILLLSCLSAPAFTDLGNHVFMSNGSFPDTQAAVTLASDGYTIRIPAGSFTWSSGLIIAGKGITIQGEGAGSLVGDSTTSLSVGTGTKVFTTQAGLDLQAGQTMRAIYTPNGGIYMEGKVVSYSGTRLELNITSKAGTGTFAFWVLSTVASTSIINGSGNAALFDITEAPGRSVELKGVCCLPGSSSGNFVNLHGITGGKPTLIHHCRFSAGGLMLRCIQVEPNRGIIFNSSFDAGFSSGGGGGNGNNNEGIGFKWEELTPSWSTPPTMGANDATGLNNFYVEDCYFAGMYLQCMDFDDNSRTVIRHCTFNNSGLVSHGQETSAYGLRHFELYNNKFIFNDVGVDTYNVNEWLYLRGGTGCIFSNEMPAITSQQWSTKPSLNLTVQALRRSTGIGCITNYPAPRQVGQGFDGTNAVTDPLYIWNNTGSGNYNTPAISDFQPDQCGNGQLATNYIQANRDYFIAPRPGYAPYVYPHPLRSFGIKSSNLAPLAVASAAVTSGPAPLKVAFSSAGSYDPEGVALTYSWTFGDGNTSVAANPTYVYRGPGTNSARLTVSDGINTAISSNVNIFVTAPVNKSPVAVVNAWPSAGVAPLTVKFSSAGSFDPEGVPLTFNWTFGDGSVSAAADPTHTYQFPGVYSAQLTVADGAIKISSNVLTITVAAENSAH
jgi:PKD repeat protein